MSSSFSNRKTSDATWPNGSSGVATDRKNGPISFTQRSNVISRIFNFGTTKQTGSDQELSLPSVAFTDPSSRNRTTVARENSIRMRSKSALRQTGELLTSPVASSLETDASNQSDAPHKEFSPSFSDSTLRGPPSEPVGRSRSVGTFTSWIGFSKNRKLTTEFSSVLRNNPTVVRVDTNYSENRSRSPRNSPSCLPTSQSSSLSNSLPSSSSSINPVNTVAVHNALSPSNWPPSGTSLGSSDRELASSRSSIHNQLTQSSEYAVGNTNNSGFPSLSIKNPSIASAGNKEEAVMDSQFVKGSLSPSVLLDFPSITVLEVPPDAREAAVAYESGMKHKNLEDFDDIGINSGLGPGVLSNSESPGSASFGCEDASKDALAISTSIFDDEETDLAKVDAILDVSPPAANISPESTSDTTNVELSDEDIEAQFLAGLLEVNEDICATSSGECVPSASPLSDYALSPFEKLLENADQQDVSIGLNRPRADSNCSKISVDSHSGTSHVPFLSISTNLSTSGRKLNSARSNRSNVIHPILPPPEDIQVNVVLTPAASKRPEGTTFSQGTQSRNYVYAEVSRSRSNSFSRNSSTSSMNHNPELSNLRSSLSSGQSTIHLAVGPAMSLRHENSVDGSSMSSISMSPRVASRDMDHTQFVSEFHLSHDGRNSTINGNNSDTSFPNSLPVDSTHVPGQLTRSRPSSEKDGRGSTNAGGLEVPPTVLSSASDLKNALSSSFVRSPPRSGTPDAALVHSPPLGSLPIPISSPSQQGFRIPSSSGLNQLGILQRNPRSRKEIPFSHPTVPALVPNAGSSASLDTPTEMADSPSTAPIIATLAGLGKTPSNSSINSTTSGNTSNSGGNSTQDGRGDLHEQLLSSIPLSIADARTSRSSSVSSASNKLPAEPPSPPSSSYRLPVPRLTHNTTIGLSNSSAVSVVTSVTTLLEGGVKDALDEALEMESSGVFSGSHSSAVSSGSNLSSLSSITSSSSLSHTSAGSASSLNPTLSAGMTTEVASNGFSSDSTQKVAAVESSVPSNISVITDNLSNDDKIHGKNDEDPCPTPTPSVVSGNSQLTTTISASAQESLPVVSNTTSDLLSKGSQETDDVSVLSSVAPAHIPQVSAPKKSPLSVSFSLDDPLQQSHFHQQQVPPLDLPSTSIGITRSMSLSNPSNPSTTTTSMSTAESVSPISDADLSEIQGVIESPVASSSLSGEEGKEHSAHFNANANKSSTAEEFPVFPHTDRLDGTDAHGNFKVGGANFSVVPSAPSRAGLPEIVSSSSLATSSAPSISERATLSSASSAHSASTSSTGSSYSSGSSSSTLSGMEEVIALANCSINIQKVTAVGATSWKGYKRSPHVIKLNQDAVLIADHQPTQSLLVGVFDGHGEFGREVSTYFRDHFPTAFFTSVNFANFCTAFPVPPPSLVDTLNVSESSLSGTGSTKSEEEFLKRKTRSVNAGSSTSTAPTSASTSLPRQQHDESVADSGRTQNTWSGSSHSNSSSSNSNSSMTENHKYAASVISTSTTSSYSSFAPGAKPLWAKQAPQLLAIMRDALLLVENVLISSPANAHIDLSLSGTTAVLSLIRGGVVHTLNVGDSRAVLASCRAPLVDLPSLSLASQFSTIHGRPSGIPFPGCGPMYLTRDDQQAFCAPVAVSGVRATPLSVDHKPLKQSEYTRVVAAGGRIVIHKSRASEAMAERVRAIADMIPPAAVDAMEARVSGICRIVGKEGVYPGLNMSRSLGDLVGKMTGIISAPHASIHIVRPGVDRALVLASDGVWDYVSEDEAATIALSNEDCFVSATGLVRLARSRWSVLSGSADDTTAIIVRFV